MDPVVITGLGVVSPLGLSAVELATRFCAGESAIGSLGNMGIDGAWGATVPEIPLDSIPVDKRTRIGRLDRLCRLFLSAAYRAVDAARLDITEVEAERVGLSFGTGLGCLLTNAEYYEKIVEHGPAAASPRLFAYTVSSAAAGEVSIALGIKGANVTTHAGLAAGLQAIGYGFDLIRMGKADVVLAGGADALGPALVHGLADMGLLKTRSDAERGVYPSEGAVVVVLERRAHARHRGARCWARIDGYAAGFEPTLTRRTRECTGIIETMRRALALSGHGAADVDIVMTSAHGTALDAAERNALAAVFDGRVPPCLAPQSALGESFGAAGALALALATALLVGLAGDVAPARCRRPTLAMVHSLCYAGPTVTLMLAREE